MFKIQKTEPNHFLEISAIDRITWKSNSFAKFIPDGEHIWRIFSEHGVMFTAFWNNEIVGAIVAIACENKSYCVHKVIVHPDQRNKGIGSDLFKYLLIELDINKVDSWLTVSPDNDNALKLYAKWGYNHKKYVKGYYREYEDRYVLNRKSSTK